MKGVSNWFLAVIVCFAIIFKRDANAQFAGLDFSDGFQRGVSLANHAPSRTQERLIFSTDVAKPGDTVWAGLDLKMEPGWHTYWANPGVGGMATKIEWQLPPGISAGEIQWPLPKKLNGVATTNYVYENEVVLLVPIQIATNLQAGPLGLSANILWVECDINGCIAAAITNHVILNIGNEEKLSPHNTTIESWRQKLPQNNDAYPFQAWWEKPATGDTRPLIINHGPTETAKNITYDSVDFYPGATDQFDVLAQTEIISTQSADISLRKVVKKFSGDWPKEISGVMVIQSGNSRYGYEVKLPVNDQAPAGVAISGQTSSENRTGETPALPLMLLYAFIGGLILNIMPCVLPVIALKILGFVSEARSEPRRVRNLGLIYALGVLVSFLALAAVVIGVKSAGHHAGWGMQFGSPIFIVCLTTLVTLVALNLFGVFEVTLGGRALDAAGNLASKHGAPGAFFNGLLATALATPCTAPFLSGALGFAFAQSASIIVLVFLFVGLGLAAPYVLLSCNPAWLKLLPKPGAWMEKFKIAMGFPMLATVLWLFNIAGSSYGNVQWLGVFLLIVGFAAWIYGNFVQRGGKNKIIALVITLLLLIGGYVFALEKELNWRNPMPFKSSLQESPGGIDWQPWSPEAVAQARAAGKPVLVDFTADWCLTCQVNKKIAIETSSVRAKLKELNTVALVGDYTHFPDAITTELNRYHNAGVPLVLVFPKEQDAPAIVLPQILTPGIVLNALNRAAQ